MIKSAAKDQYDATLQRFLKLRTAPSSCQEVLNLAELIWAEQSVDGNARGEMKSLKREFLLSFTDFKVESWIRYDCIGV
jgi:hypothetical protein